MHVRTNRQASKTVHGSTESNNESTSHIYDEINKFPSNCSKVTDGKSAKCLKDEVIFDVHDTYLQPPTTYQVAATIKPVYNDCKTKSCNYNDYYIKGENR